MAELFSRPYLLLCETIPNRKTFFQDLQALTDDNSFPHAITDLLHSKESTIFFFNAA
ncbi:hypothetical protein [Sediminispirochaeta bajacaliforniensis]|uniref:hypothetical protein n=1 Tax=Sediminispirochaeta bajacaliforniensis TaxID=148 RepID=UPI00039AA20D|nr:hypothetical protein [Sediminispirochaeta bajacaliforniensis]